METEGRSNPLLRLFVPAPVPLEVEEAEEDEKVKRPAIVLQQQAAVVERSRRRHPGSILPRSDCALGVEMAQGSRCCRYRNAVPQR